MSKSLFLNVVARGNDSGQVVFSAGTSVVCREFMNEVGVHFPEGHLDAEKMATLAMAGYMVLGFDVVIPLFSVCHEAAAGFLETGIDGSGA